MRSFFRLNVSVTEVKKLERIINIKTIRNVDISLLKQTLIFSKNAEKKDRIFHLFETLRRQLPAPNNISELTQGVASGKYKKYEGTNREVFIDKITGRGYKVFKLNSTWSDLHTADLRINDIYSHSEFYGGKYASLASNEIIDMIDDRTKDKARIKVFAFNKIPHAIPLRDDEKIPHSVLLMMEQAGFRPFDVKPDNFMKVRSSCDEYDYLPIDAKQIGLDRSSTWRSLQVQEFQSRFGPYYYEQCYVDYDK
jgi:hypothetical protein